MEYYLSSGVRGCRWVFLLGYVEMHDVKRIRTCMAYNMMPSKDHHHHTGGQQSEHNLLRPRLEVCVRVYVFLPRVSAAGEIENIAINFQMSCTY